MSSYLKNLLAKSVHQLADIRPRLGSRFEEMPLAAFGDSDKNGESLYQAQESGSQPRREKERGDYQIRQNNEGSVRNNALSAAVHVVKEVGNTKSPEGGNATLISEKRGSVLHDSHVELEHGSPPQAWESGTGQEKKEKISGKASPPLFEERKGKSAPSIKIVRKMEAEPRVTEPAEALPSSPDRETVVQQNRFDNLTSKAFMPDGADRNKRDLDRGVVESRQEVSEKSGILRQRIEQTNRHMQPDIPERYEKKRNTPSVRVTIGRIEIRAVREKKQQPAVVNKQVLPRRPALSLDDYLCQRSERGR